jgi:hypothetical protein
MSGWGSTVHDHEEYGPREVAYDLGWSDGFDGRPIRDGSEFLPDEYRGYCYGYRLGEQWRGDGSAGERLYVPPTHIAGFTAEQDRKLFAEVDKLIWRVHDTRAGRYVALVVTCVVVVLVLLVIYK